jgi:hypothetical protein
MQVRMKDDVDMSDADMDDADADADVDMDILHTPPQIPRIELDLISPQRGRQILKKRSRSSREASADSRHSKISRKSVSSSAVSSASMVSSAAGPPHSPTLSEASLQGASRTAGGLFRGKALGNSLNLADTCK